MASDNDNAMLDLETLGKGNKAVVSAIGIVMFDPVAKTIDKANGFYQLVDVQSCVDHGLQMDVSTVLWWMKQSDAARAIYTTDKPKPKLPSVLDALIEWFGGRDIPVWGNGATFDNVILRNAFNACGHEAPWSYWNDRCYRTMKSLHPDVKMARTGTHHNAYDDAVSQANHLINILNQGA